MIGSGDVVLDNKEALKTTEQLREQNGKLQTEKDNLRQENLELY